MVGSIGSFDAASYVANAALTRKNAANANKTTTDLGQATSKTPDAKSTFMDYMKMSPAERMEQDWLKAHGLSKEKLAAMSPSEREKVLKQMKDDIEQKMKDQANQKASVDILA